MSQVSHSLECALCRDLEAEGYAGHDGHQAAQSVPVDPSSTAYRVHAHAFNTLTRMLAADDRFVPLSVREAVARAIVEAVEPIIRADEHDQLRDGVAALAARLDASADVTRPSRKSDIESEIATALRQLLEGQ